MTELAFTNSRMALVLVEIIGEMHNVLISRLWAVQVSLDSSCYLKIELLQFWKQMISSYAYLPTYACIDGYTDSISEQVQVLARSLLQLLNSIRLILFTLSIEKCSLRRGQNYQVRSYHYLERVTAPPYSCTLACSLFLHGPETNEHLFRVFTLETLVQGRNKSSIAHLLFLIKDWY